MTPPPPPEYSGRRSKKIVINLGLLLVSLVLGLVLGELTLRWLWPKYEGVAEAEFDADAIRIWARRANNRGRYEHPDRGTYHALYHNNLALRQHRDFHESDIEAATNVGIFGDSFVENVRLESEYSLNEPLDYLLNQSGSTINVMNFGVEGYGPGQSFLHYENFKYAADLDHVFYVFCDNDIRNIYETNLFYHDEMGQIVRNDLIKPPGLWKRFYSQLHLSYLFLESLERVRQFKLGIEQLRDNRMKRAYGLKGQRFREKLVDDEGMRRQLDVFKHIMRTWKTLVEDRGGKFYIVLLPRWQSQVLLPSIIDELTVVNLYECFSEHGNSYDGMLQYGSSLYRFKNDNHWNEAGNQLAAVCLYRFLEREMGLPRLAEDELREALYRYYSAFGGLMPDQYRMKKVAVSLQELAGIREKYLALEHDQDEE